MKLQKVKGFEITHFTFLVDSLQDRPIFGIFPSGTSPAQLVSYTDARRIAHAAHVIDARS